MIFMVGFSGPTTRLTLMQRLGIYLTKFDYENYSAVVHAARRLTKGGINNIKEDSNHVLSIENDTREKYEKIKIKRDDKEILSYNDDNFHKPSSWFYEGNIKEWGSLIISEEIKNR